ncbi:hypothetical protein KUCAC02_032200, partial [Chaenocephalus aceratus]
AVFPLLVPNATLHSAEIPTNSRKTLSEPRPVRFVASILTFTSLPASSQWSAAPTEVISCVR